MNFVQTHFNSGMNLLIDDSRLPVMFEYKIGDNPYKMVTTNIVLVLMFAIDLMFFNLYYNLLKILLPLQELNKNVLRLVITLFCLLLVMLIIAIILILVGLKFLSFKCHQLLRAFGQNRFQ